MCVVSMIGDQFRGRWEPHYPDWQAWTVTGQTIALPVTREEFDALKREVEILRDLLKAAKEYDAKNNEPACETDEKMNMLRAIAKAVGVDLDGNHGG